MHILEHSPFLILWYCLIAVKFINDPCNSVFYLISVPLKEQNDLVTLGQPGRALTWFPTSVPGEPAAGAAVCS